MPEKVWEWGHPVHNKKMTKERYYGFLLEDCGCEAKYAKCDIFKTTFIGI